MTLRLGTRLTVYYVSSIAVILAGFSIALYVMAAKHLFRQVDERIDSALSTLVAAAEIGPHGVVWEPEERSLSFGRRSFEGRFVWRVADESGQRIDGSATGEIDRALASLEAGADPARRFASFSEASGVKWRAVSRRLDRAQPIRAGAASSESDDELHHGLVLGAATALDEAQTNLRNLALALAGLSLAVWVLALVVTRRLCRLALRPLSEMADAAHSIGGDEPGRRIPAPRTDDELGELGRSFNALLERLGESLERQQRFTGDASHQLGTPLTAIQGHVDLALRQERSAEEYLRVLTLVQSKTRHLRQIVDGLMFLSRADAEARRPVLERVALDPWLRAHLAAWPDPRRSDIVYESEGQEACHARVHEPLLGELLNNLLDNAAKYSPPGTPIRVRLSHQNEQIAFSLTNDGPGIDRADLASVFDPFFRSERARMRGSSGLGLGLSIAARIACAFGGRITVSSTPGQGATFSVNLPKSDR
jgi:two-component system, OmpR family, sensor kinase